MHVDTDDLATLLKMQHLDLEAMRDKKKLEELPQRAVILEARSKKKAIEQKRAQLDALHAKADAQLSRIDDEDRSLSEKQRQVQSEIDAVRGDYRGVEARTKELNGFAKRRNTLEADLTAVGDELAKIDDRPRHSYHKPDHPLYLVDTNKSFPSLDHNDKIHSYR